MKKLVTGIDAYNSDTAMGDMLSADVLSNNKEFYRTTKYIFTRTYCDNTVEYIYDLSISNNYTQRYGSCDWTCMARLLSLTYHSRTIHMYQHIA